MDNFDKYLGIKSIRLGNEQHVKGKGKGGGRGDAQISDVCK